MTRFKRCLTCSHTAISRVCGRSFYMGSAEDWCPQVRRSSENDQHMTNICGFANGPSAHTSAKLLRSDCAHCQEPWEAEIAALALTWVLKRLVVGGGGPTVSLIFFVKKISRQETPNSVWGAKRRMYSNFDDDDDDDDDDDVDDDGLKKHKNNAQDLSNQCCWWFHPQLWLQLPAWLDLEARILLWRDRFWLPRQEEEHPDQNTSDHLLPTLPNSCTFQHSVSRLRQIRAVSEARQKGLPQNPKAHQRRFSLLKSKEGDPSPH